MSVEVLGIDEKRIDHKPGVVTFGGRAGGVFYRSIFIEKAGIEMEGHKHTFDHKTVLAKGKVRIEVEGSEPTEATAPAMFTVEKGKVHKFIALSDDVVLVCVHLVDEKEKIAWGPSLEEQTRMHPPKP